MKYYLIVFTLIFVIISCDSEVEPNLELQCDTSNIVKTDVTGQVLISRSTDQWKLDIQPSDYKKDIYLKIRPLFPNPTSTRTNSTFYFELLKDAKVKIMLEKANS
jgi:hypothetical protein